MGVCNALAATLGAQCERDGRRQLVLVPPPNGTALVQVRRAVGPCALYRSRIRSCVRSGRRLRRWHRRLGGCNVSRCGVQAQQRFAATLQAMHEKWTVRRAAPQLTVLAVWKESEPSGGAGGRRSSGVAEHKQT